MTHVATFGRQTIMPANGTEGEIFICGWCADCVHDDEENEEYCEILSNSFFGTQPKEWTWRGGKPHLFCLRAVHAWRSQTRPALHSNAGDVLVNALYFLSGAITATGILMQAFERGDGWGVCILFGAAIAIAAAAAESHPR